MTLAAARTRVLGVLVVAVAAWGGVVAFVGPSFGFTVRGTQSDWVWSQDHATLNLAPALGGVVGGILLAAAAGALLMRLGAVLALISGVWFLIGAALEPLWNPAGVSTLGASSSLTMRALEQIGYYDGTGAVIVALAASALALLTLVPVAAAVTVRRSADSEPTRVRTQTPSPA